MTSTQTSHPYGRKKALGGRYINQLQFLSHFEDMGDEYSQQGLAGVWTALFHCVRSWVFMAFLESFFLGLCGRQNIEYIAQSISLIGQNYDPSQ